MNRPQRKAARAPGSGLEALTAGLRAWTRGHDPHVRAAVGLLIEHGFWLRRPDFTRACVHRSGREAWIDWDAARRFCDQGPQASTSEMAILDLAVALGENRYRLSIMGAGNSRLIADAVAAAVGVQREYIPETGDYPPGPDQVYGDAWYEAEGLDP